MATLPRPGQVQWIGLRPARDVAMRAVAGVEAIAGRGLVGDRYASGSGKRGITLIQAEHLPVIAALSGHDSVAPALLRRNVVVSGIPLVALKGRRFRIGQALFEGTDDCDPCSRMEAALGPGGYNAMRGHGGLCARILEGGMIAVGDSVQPVAAA
ncbi:MOSC domain-containing protein [Arenimonas terrae]|uniref:MOSC domain-containing protein n=2 Tax=Arenimonas terrae TaxID=2546226 RepID=A0A5C4RXJ0_9GAMM|nr:MOSC domain-containing protein [Arenimonas terrae]